MTTSTVGALAECTATARPEPASTQDTSRGIGSSSGSKGSPLPVATTPTASPSGVRVWSISGSSWGSAQSTGSGSSAPFTYTWTGTASPEASAKGPAISPNWKSGRRVVSPEQTVTFEPPSSGVDWPPVLRPWTTYTSVVAWAPTGPDGAPTTSNAAAARIMSALFIVCSCPHLDLGRNRCPAEWTHAQHGQPNGIRLISLGHLVTNRANQPDTRTPRRRVAGVEQLTNPLDRRHFRSPMQLPLQRMAETCPCRALSWCGVSGARGGTRTSTEPIPTSGSKPHIVGHSKESRVRCPHRSRPVLARFGPSGSNPVAVPTFV